MKPILKEKIIKAEYNYRKGWACYIGIKPEEINPILIDKWIRGMYERKITDKEGLDWFEKFIANTIYGNNSGKIKNGMTTIICSITIILFENE